MPQRVLSRLSANDVDARGRARGLHPVARRPPAASSPTSPSRGSPRKRFLVVATDLIHRRIEPHDPPRTRATTRSSSSPTSRRPPRCCRCRGRARASCSDRLTDADLSNDAFPYLTARDIHVGYAPVRAAAGDLRRRARLGAARPDRVRPRGLRRPDGGGPGPRASATSGSPRCRSLRLEKGYRDLGVDIDNTDTPLEARSRVRCRLGQARRVHRTRRARWRHATRVRPKLRVVSLFVDDPSLDLFGNEPVLLDGEWVGYVRAAAFGHTLGGPVGLAEVSCPDGVTAAWLAAAGDFTVRTPHREVPAQLRLGPLYDPDRSRILAR